MLTDVDKSEVNLYEVSKLLFLFGFEMSMMSVRLYMCGMMLLSRASVDFVTVLDDLLNL